MSSLLLAGCAFDRSGSGFARDATPAPDADPNAPDADPNAPDADPNAPDAAPSLPDAAPSADATPSVVVRYNIGGSDHTGTDFPGFWAADPGNVCSGNLDTHTGDIQQTVDDALFLFRYWGNISCSINSLPSGNYTLSLLFAEVYIGCPGVGGGTGTRRFNVLAEGTTVESNLDVFAASGGCAFSTGGPLRRSYTGINVVDGTMSVLLAPVADDAILQAIEVVSEF